MRVTIHPRRHLVTVVVALAITLSVLLLVVAVGGVATSEDADDTYTPTAAATTPDTGLANPWAAGDEAVLRELAELGRAHLEGCP